MLLFHVEVPEFQVAAQMAVHRGLVVGRQTSPELRLLEGRSLPEAVEAIEAKLAGKVHRMHPTSNDLVPWNQDTQRIHVREMQPWDVYVGRKGYGYDHRPEAGVYGNTKGSVENFERWATRCLESGNSLFRARMHVLYGMRLACFCQPGKRCHGDVLVEVAEKLEGPVGAEEAALSSVVSKLGG